jgi:hypothetical protein
MNEQDVKDIIGMISEAVKVALGDKWEEAKDFAESESKKFGQNIAEIALWKETGKITEEQGRVLLRMHQRSMKMVLTALEGISLVLAEKAINAAIDAISGIVNSLIGWDVF